MSLLSPRFLTLPLIALTVILMLPRQPDASSAQTSVALQPTVQKAVTCASPGAASACAIAISSHSVVR